MRCVAVKINTTHQCCSTMGRLVAIDCDLTYCFDIITVLIDGVVPITQSIHMIGYIGFFANNDSISGVSCQP